jgi:glycosyltransferase involved in cell wall biosynthesis
MNKRLISFLVPDISAPSVGAALRMADALVRDFDIEIVGPDFGRGVNSMYRDEFRFKPVSCPGIYRLPDFWWQTRRLERALSGDIIIALKAFRHTVPVALAARRRRGARVVVFLDEWDGAALAHLTPWQRRVRLWRQWSLPLEDGHYPSVEEQIPEADSVWSTTTFLQRKFGGHLIAMGVDTDKFQPQPPDQVAALRHSLHLEGLRLIVFGGLVRPHKGVEIIPEALAKLGDNSIRLLVVGPVTEHLEALLRDRRYAPYIQVAGAPPGDPQGINNAIHKQMPLYLDLAELVVLPLLDTPLAQSQMPIKLFEALAMAKPVIGSAVSDLPAMLNSCGAVVPPGDVGALADAIRRLLDAPAHARELGTRARTECLERYSRPVVQTRLTDILRSL